jgi:hypothetical protein
MKPIDVNREFSTEITYYEQLEKTRNRAGCVALTLTQTAYQLRSRKTGNVPEGFPGRRSYFDFI